MFTGVFCLKTVLEKAIVEKDQGIFPHSLCLDQIEHAQGLVYTPIGYICRFISKTHFQSKYMLYDLHCLLKDQSGMFLFITLIPSEEHICAPTILH